MPVNVPDKLPAINILREENIFVMNESRAKHQDIRPLKIIILNLMPLKINAETDLLRLLSNSPLQIEIDFMKIKGHKTKNTSFSHMKRFYKNFDDLRNMKYDGMIITGAPVELMPFEDVTYGGSCRRYLTGPEHHVFLYVYFLGQSGRIYLLLRNIP